RDPDIKLLRLLPDVDRPQRPLRRLSRLAQLADLHLQRHVRDPQLRRVGLPEKETLVVRGALRAVDVQLSRLVDFDARPLASLARLLGARASVVVLRGRGVAEGVGRPVVFGPEAAELSAALLLFVAL